MFESVLGKKKIKPCLAQEIRVAKDKEKITVIKEINFMNKHGPDSPIYFITGDNKGNAKIFTIEKKARIPKTICLTKTSGSAFESRSEITEILLWPSQKYILTASDDGKLVFYSATKKFRSSMIRLYEKF